MRRLQSVLSFHPVASGDKTQVIWLSYSLNLLSHLASLIISLCQSEATERSSRRAPLLAIFALLHQKITLNEQFQKCHSLVASFTLEFGKVVALMTLKWPWVISESIKADFACFYEKKKNPVQHGDPGLRLEAIQPACLLNPLAG